VNAPFSAPQPQWEAGSPSYTSSKTADSGYVSGYVSGYASPPPATGGYTDVFIDLPYSSKRTYTSIDASVVAPWVFPSRSPSSSISTMPYTWASDESPAPPISLAYMSTSPYPMALPTSASNDTTFGCSQQHQRDEPPHRFRAPLPRDSRIDNLAQQQQQQQRLKAGKTPEDALDHDRVDGKRARRDLEVPQHKMGEIGDETMLERDNQDTKPMMKDHLQPSPSSSIQITTIDSSGFCSYLCESEVSMVSLRGCVEAKCSPMAVRTRQTWHHGLRPGVL
jgi:hypothetical protein